jgi:branched-chain amino acid transport system ATP-binding protein
MVEQNFRFASRYADRFYVIEEGQVIETFHQQDIASNRDRIEKLLGL